MGNPTRTRGCCPRRFAPFFLVRCSEKAERTGLRILQKKPAEEWQTNGLSSRSQVGAALFNGRDVKLHTISTSRIGLDQRPIDAASPYVILENIAIKRPSDQFTTYLICHLSIPRAPRPASQLRSWQIITYFRYECKYPIRLRLIISNMKIE